MAHSVQVKVLRLHSGDAGQHVEGSVYATHQTHARELAARGLVEIIDPAPAPPPPPAVAKGRGGRQIQDA